MSDDAKIYAVIEEMGRGQLIDMLEQGLGYDPNMLKNYGTDALRVWVRTRYEEGSIEDFTILNVAGYA
jgi:hypothetical protein